MRFAEKGSILPKRKAIHRGVMTTGIPHRAYMPKWLQYGDGKVVSGFTDWDSETRPRQMDESAHARGREEMVILCRTFR